MAEKVKWFCILLVLIFVLYGMWKVESVLTEGEVKKGGCGCGYRCWTRGE